VNALANIENAKSLLAQAHDFDQLQFVKAMLKEAEIQARKKGLVDVEALAASYKVLVIRKIGQLLIEMKETGERKTGHENLPRSHSESTPSAKTLKDLGITKNESSQYQALARQSPEQFENTVKTTEKKVAAAARAAIKEAAYQEENAKKKAALARSSKTKPLPDSIQLFNGEFQKEGSRIANDSVDLIFTDPPYPEEFLKLWGDLATPATRVLKPGGYLISYSGQSFLPRVMAMVGKHLDWYWMAGTQHTSNQEIIWKTNVKNRWKPILIYSKGQGRKHQAIFDLLTGEKGEKALHEWSQGVRGALLHREVHRT